MRLKLLGPLRFERADGSAMPAPGAKATAVIALLATAPDGTRKRAEIAETLWSDRDPAAARHALRQCLMRLRGFDELAGVLQADREAVRLDLDQVEVDVRTLQALAGAGAVLDPRGVARLCRGGFCAGLDVADEPFERWLRRKRTELGRLQAGVLSRAAERAVALGDGDAAAELARRRVAIDPYEESAQAALIAICMHFGRYGEARSAHEACTETFRGELGVEPGPSVAAALAVSPDAQPVALPIASPWSDRRVTSAGRRGGRLAAVVGDLPPAATALAATLLLAVVLGHREVPVDAPDPAPAQARLWVMADDRPSWRGNATEADWGASKQGEEVALEVSTEEAVRRALRGEAEYAVLYPTGC